MWTLDAMSIYLENALSSRSSEEVARSLYMESSVFASCVSAMTVTSSSSSASVTASASDSEEEDEEVSSVSTAAAAAAPRAGLKLVLFLKRHK